MEINPEAQASLDTFISLLGLRDSDELFNEAIVVYATIVEGVLNGKKPALMDENLKTYQIIELPSLTKLSEDAGSADEG